MISNSMLLKGVNTDQAVLDVFFRFRSDCGTAIVLQVWHKKISIEMEQILNYVGT